MPPLFERSRSAKADRLLVFLPVFAGLAGTAAFQTGKSTVPTVHNNVPFFSPDIVLVIVNAVAADLLPSIELLIFCHFATSNFFIINLIRFNVNTPD